MYLMRTDGNIFQKTYVSVWAYHVVVKYKSQFGLESLVYPKPGFTLKTRLSNCPMMQIYNFFSSVRLGILFCGADILGWSSSKVSYANSMPQWAKNGIKYN